MNLESGHMVDELGWLLLSAGLVGIATLGFGWLVGLPLWRQERARFFVDFLALIMKRGLPLEQTICSAAHTRDTSLGVQFHLLSAWLEKGLTLSQALEKTPGYLPPAMTALLRAGERSGNLSGAIEASRNLLNDGSSKFLNAQNYLAMLPFGLAALGMLWVIPGMFVFVAPKYAEIFRDMTQDMNVAKPWLFTYVIQHASGITVIGAITALLVLLMPFPVLFYLGGPRFTLWLNSGLPQLWDRILWSVPWHRFRCLRDFIGALAMLLDGGIAEPEAVRLAAECSGNQVVAGRTRRVVERLRSGQPFPMAMRALCGSPEFQWRLENACHARHRFSDALRGWQEALDARAMQLEQAFAQILTTCLVLINGAVVGVVVVAFFQTITAITNEVALW